MLLIKHVAKDHYLSKFDKLYLVTKVDVVYFLVRTILM